MSTGLADTKREKGNENEVKANLSVCSDGKKYNAIS